MHRNALDYVEMREYVEIRGLFFALGRNSGEFTLGKICSGKKKKIGKKGENFANFRKNWRDFGKIGEILEKIEGISGDFAVKKKQF